MSDFTLTVVRGHNSPETAHVTEDYPYGRTLRCKRRVWVERATKGSQKGKERFCSQTTNPRCTTHEMWNKPKYGIYSERVYLVIDNRTGYIQGFQFSAHNPRDWANLHASGVFAQLTPEEQKDATQLDKYTQILNRRWCKPGEFDSWQRHNILMGRIRERLNPGEFINMTDPKAWIENLSEVVGILDFSGGQTAYSGDLEDAFAQVMAEDWKFYTRIPVYHSED